MACTPQVEPMVSLPQQEIKTLEDGKEELFKVQAKLFRLASENSVPEWKEWGTSNIKLVKPEQKGAIYFLARRDKTLKACANHYITVVMELKPNAGGDPHLGLERPKRERLATRFLDAENAQEFQQSLKNAGEVEESTIRQKTMMPRKPEKLEAPPVEEESKGV